MNQIKQSIKARQEQLVDLRRDFHRFPELSFEEKRTAEVIEAQLRSFGLDQVQAGMKGVYGVAGTLKGGKPGRTLLIRADIDGLPILEQNGVNYVSENKGVMHACGHDGHAAIALTLAGTYSSKGWTFRAAKLAR